jgi:hypothetical protein
MEKTREEQKEIFDKIRKFGTQWVHDIQEDITEEEFHKLPFLLKAMIEISGRERNAAAIKVQLSWRMKKARMILQSKRLHWQNRNHRFRLLLTHCIKKRKEVPERAVNVIQNAWRASKIRKILSKWEEIAKENSCWDDYKQPLCDKLAMLSYVGELNIIKFLLKENNYLFRKNINKISVDMSNRTPLTVAASQWNLSIVEFLVENGANVNKIDGNGYSPLDMALAQNVRIDGYTQIENGQKVVDFLCSNGANAISKGEYPFPSILFTFAPFSTRNSTIDKFHCDAATVNGVRFDMSTEILFIFFLNK